MMLRISDEHPTPPGKHALRLFLERGSRPPSRTGRVKEVKATDPNNPTRCAGRVFSQMEVGDSVFFPVRREEEAKDRSRLMNAARKRKMLVLTRSTFEDRVFGFRVWRID
jgi:hypothetical protein